MPTNKASAVWTGTLKGGSGELKGASGSVRGAYTFASRFETGDQTNPEQHLAAAQAACFSMALSGALEKNGTPPESVETNAACTVEKVGDRFSITTITLDVRARVRGVDEATFQRLAEETKEGCPVSRALKGNVKMELTARLES